MNRILHSRLGKLVVVTLLICAMVGAPLQMAQSVNGAEETAAAVPQISHQPSDATYAKGAAARFYVNADSVDGGYLTYQWHCSAEYSSPVTGGNRDGTLTDAQILAIKANPGTITEVGGSGTKATLTCETPAGGGAGYYYYWVEITNHKDLNGDGDTTGEGEQSVKDSRLALMKVVDRTLFASVQHGDFEGMGLGSGNTPSTIYPSLAAYHPSDGWWNTTQYHIGNTYVKTLEVNTGYHYLGARTSNFTAVAELSAWEKSTLFQEIASVPGKIYEWSLDHGARSIDETMAVIIGPAINEESDYDKLGLNGTSKRWIVEPTTANLPANIAAYPYGINDSAYFQDIAQKLAEDEGVTFDTLASSDYSDKVYSTVYAGQTYYVYISTAARSDDFQHRKGVYSVPAGQGTTVFGFVNIKSESPNAGNILDNIVFQPGTGLNAEQAMTYTSDTSLSTITKAGYAYGLAEIRGSSAENLSGLSVFYDADGAGAGTEVPAAPDTDLGTGGWYTAAGASAFAAGGVITFKDLTPGKTYRIIGIPIGAVSPALHTNESPVNVLDEGYYRDTAILPASLGGEHMISNVDTELYEAGGQPYARVAVENARNDVEYALLAGNAEGPDTVGPATTGTDWANSGDGRVVFGGLSPDTYYYLVSRPLGYSEIGYADAAYADDGTTPAYIRVHTPAADVTDINPANVTRASDGLSVSVANTRPGFTYAVIDPDTGEILGETHEGDGQTFTVNGLTAGKAYQVVCKTGDSTWLRGVRVYPYPDALSIDWTAGTIGSTAGLANGAIPHSVEYRIRAKNAPENTWIVGGAEEWRRAVGTSRIDLSDAAYTGKGRSVFDELDALNAAAGASVAYRLVAGLDGYDGASVSPALTLDFPVRPAAPAEGPAQDFTRSYSSETFSPASGHSVETEQGGGWTALSAGTGFAALGWTGSGDKTFRARIPASAAEPCAFASDIAQITIPGRGLAPTGLTVAMNETDDAITFGGLNPSIAYQYRTDGEAWSAPLSGVENTGPLPYDAGAGDYDLRFAAAEPDYAVTPPGGAPASFAVTVSTPLNLMPVNFAPRIYGAAGGDPLFVTINNIGDVSVLVTALNLTGDQASAFTAAAAADTEEAWTVPAFSAGGENTNWSIAPNAGLSAGSYHTTAEIEYSYADAPHTSKADVWLTVGKADWNMENIGGEISAASADSLTLSVSGAPDGAPLAYSYGGAYAAGGVAPVFGGLSAATPYEIRVKALADDNHVESAAVLLLTGYTAYAAPANVVSVDYRGEKLVFNQGFNPADYLVTIGENTIQNQGSLTAYAEAGDFTISALRKASGNIPASAAELVPVQGKDPAPDGFTTVKTSTESSNDGEIRLTGAFEYRIHRDGDATSGWASASGSVLLPVGSYDIRRPVPADNSKFASKAAPAAVTANVFLVTLHTRTYGDSPYTAPGGIQLPAAWNAAGEDGAFTHTYSINNTPLDLPAVSAVTSGTHVFTGWYGAPSFAGSPVTATPIELGTAPGTDDLQSHDYWAKWAVKPTVTAVAGASPSFPDTNAGLSASAPIQGGVLVSASAASVSLTSDMTSNIIIADNSDSVSAALYTDDAFSEPAAGGGIALTPGVPKHIYIQTTSKDDDVTKVYYDLTVTRAGSYSMALTNAAGGGALTDPDSETPAYIFTGAAYGYAAQTALGVAVTNTGNMATGNLSVSLSGAGASAFTLSTASVGGIAAGQGAGTAAFTLVPKTGLAAGTYTETATVAAAAGNPAEIAAQSFTVSFTVAQKTLTVNLAVANKRYDGLNTAAYATAPSLAGVEGGDTAAAMLRTDAGDGVPTFSAAGIADDIPIEFTDFVLTGSAAGNYTLTQPTGVTANITSGFTPVRDTHYTITGILPDGTSASLPANGWSKGEVVITAASGYQVSLTNTDGGTWSDALPGYTAETAGGAPQFYVRRTGEATGAGGGAIAQNEISTQKTEAYKIDLTAPTGTVTVKDNAFTEFLNTITFGLFFKSTVTAAISGADAAGSANSGIPAGGIAYKKANANNAYANEAAAIADAAGWTAGTSFSMLPADKGKYVVYGRITDTAGNTTVINSDGVVVYADSAQSTASIGFTKASGENKEAAVTLNGNTVKGITNSNGDTLTPGSHYSVSDTGIITFRSAYLDTLAAGGYTLTVSYYPQGVGTAAAPGSGSDAPAVTAIALTVSLAAGSPLTLTGLGASYTYGDSDYTVGVNGAQGGGAVAYSSDTPSVAAVDASTGLVCLVRPGTFKITATQATDGVYAEKSAESAAVTVYKAAPHVSLDAAGGVHETHYGDSVTLTAAVTGYGVGAVPTGSISFYKKKLDAPNADDQYVLLATDVAIGIDGVAEAIHDVSGLAAGAFDFKAVYNGSDYYLADGYDEVAGYNIAKANQSDLTVVDPGAKTYGDAAFPLAAPAPDATGTGTAGGGSIGGDGGAVSFSVPADNGVLSLSVSEGVTTAAILGAGSVVVGVTRAESDDFNAKTGTPLTITVAPKPVSISGVSAQDKAYDGTAAAVILGTPVIESKANAEDAVSVVNGSAAFAGADAGGGVAVSFSGFTLSGAKAGSYTLSAQPAGVTANIAAKELTVNAAVKNKKYDGLNTAEWTQTPTLNGVVGTEPVGLSVPTPTFSSPEVANGISVNLSPALFALTGDADILKNYSLTQPGPMAANIANGFAAVKNTHYTVNSNAWQNTDFVVTAASGYALSYGDTEGSTWTQTLSRSGETASGSMEFYVRKTSAGDDGDIAQWDISQAAAETYKIDLTAPTAQVSYRTNAFKQFLNTVSFGRFFKNSTVTVTIRGEDTASAGDSPANSGVAQVAYYRAEGEVANPSGITDWTIVNSPAAPGSTLDATFNIAEKEKFILYSKVTDAAGNTNYCYEGVAVYTDAAQGTAGLHFVIGESADKTAAVTLNGNTVLSVANTTVQESPQLLTEGTHYTAAGLGEAGTVTLKNSYLSSLAAGSYTFTVAYLPMGLTYADDGAGAGAINEAPGTTSFTLTVSRAQPVVKQTPRATGLEPSDISRVHGEEASARPDRLSDSGIMGGVVQTLSGGVWIDVAGSWAWDEDAETPADPNETFAARGVYTRAAVFTPADTDSFTAVTANVTVTVFSPKTIITEIPAAASLFYGQALSASALTGGAAIESGTDGAVAGVFSWMDGTEVLGVGTALRGVTFTPDDLAEGTDAVSGLLPSYANAAVTVEKARPALGTEGTASPIRADDEAGESVLSGYVFTNPYTGEEVAGTLAWKEPGAVFDRAGSYEIQAVFTPTGAFADFYLETEIEVTLEVRSRFMSFTDPETEITVSGNFDMPPVELVVVKLSDTDKADYSWLKYPDMELFAAYEVHLEPAYELGPGEFLTLSFSAAGTAEGTALLVRHGLDRAGGKFEEFKPVVTGGRAEITTGSLSPFLLHRDRLIDPADGDGGDGSGNGAGDGNGDGVGNAGAGGNYRAGSGSGATGDSGAVSLWWALSGAAVLLLLVLLAAARVRSRARMRGRKREVG
ncbi:MAG: YDG domain-containing protein [Clostridiales Family XIII bacterium]|jgi:hypothetical protein|nr:YDG domain-containing protein [Clostridiales Family XIII bacterium]